jgi:hypothetical protein
LAPFSAQAWTATQLESGDSCLRWPNDRAASRPFPAATRLPDVPVLVVSGDLDTNTPSQSGRMAAGQFPHAHYVRIPNVGHTPEASPCGVSLGLRFVATLKVNPRACAGTGAPPPIAARTPRVTGDLPLVRGQGTPSDRRALAVVVATAADMGEQSELLGIWKAADGLRGGRYVISAAGVRLDGVRVVRDATASGLLSTTSAGRVTGTVRLTGAGVSKGQLHVRLTAANRGRATGRLGGRPVDLSFRF